MIVKDLVLSHQRVAEPHKNVRVVVGIYEDYDELYLPPRSVDYVIQEYGDYPVKNWFQTSETTSKGILIEIDILIGDKA